MNSNFPEVKICHYDKFTGVIKQMLWYDCVLDKFLQNNQDDAWTWENSGPNVSVI